MDGDFGGGKAKMSQPPPASTDSNPNALRRNSRVASTAGVNRMMWAPLIIGLA